MRDSQANYFVGHKQTDRNEYDSRRAFVVHSDTKPRYETTKSGEHGEETGHHQTSHTATQDVQNCMNVPHGMFGNINFAKEMEDK